MVSWVTTEELVFPYMQIFETGFSQLNKPGILSLEFVDPNLSWKKLHYKHWS